MSDNRPDRRFEDKVALITGAASGIGKATAIRLAAEGATVMLADINEAGMAETLAEIKQGGGTAAAVAFNALSNDSCEAIVGQTLAHFGRLDILGNIAGVVSLYHLEELSNDIWNRFLQINLTAPMILSREAMPHLLESKGCIVNLCSTASVGGQAYNAGYVASKHGLLGLTKTLSLEFAKRGVRVNAICPGAVATPLNDTIRWPDDIDESLVQRLFPTKPGAAQADEIAAIFAFLSSEEAQFVTGAGWVVDGGQTV